MTGPVGHPRCRLLYCEFPSFESCLWLIIAVTPEKLCGTDFSKHLSMVYEQRELNRLVIDEVCLSNLLFLFLSISISQAHCISEWGNDFRPEYRRLGVFRQRFPETPIMALTASATPSLVNNHSRLSTPSNTYPGYKMISLRI